MKLFNSSDILHREYLQPPPWSKEWQESIKFRSLFFLENKKEARIYIFYLCLFSFFISWFWQETCSYMVLSLVDLNVCATCLWSFMFFIPCNNLLCDMVAASLNTSDIMDWATAAMLNKFPWEYSGWGGYTWRLILSRRWTSSTNTTSSRRILTLIHDMYLSMSYLFIDGKISRVLREEKYCS